MAVTNLHRVVQISIQDLKWMNSLELVETLLDIFVDMDANKWREKVDARSAVHSYKWNDFLYFHKSEKYACPDHSVN